MIVVTPFYDPNTAVLMWPIVEPLIARATDLSENFDTDKIFEYIKAGGNLLVVMHENDKPIAALTLNVEHKLKKSVLTIGFCGGERIDEWYDNFIDFADAEGIRCGCTELRVHSIRKGWERFGNKLAGAKEWTPAITILTRKVKEI